MSARDGSQGTSAAPLPSGEGRGWVRRESAVRCGMTSDRKRSFGAGLEPPAPQGRAGWGIARSAILLSGACPTAGGKPLRGLPHPSPPLRGGSAAARVESAA